GEGWVQYKWDRTNPNSLEISGRDGKPLPDFEQSPIIWPPVSQTPAPEPQPEPQPEPEPEPQPEPTQPSLVANGAFGGGWDTNPKTGNQVPKGWGLQITPNGQPNIWALKKQGRNNVGSIAAVVPECVHKLPSQLPAIEQRGQARALIIEDAVNVFKC